MSDIFYADADGDGYNELGQWDTSGDGVADSFTFDADADGYSETLAFDTNGDGAVDTVQVDTDLDGVVDRTGVDYNGDGVLDHADGTGVDLVIQGPPAYLSPAGGDGTDALMSSLPYANPLQQVMIYDIIQSRDIAVDNALAMASEDD